ncbi:MAG TPA: hypothetical protein VD969_24505 [Symbiobacteriaceae bacterium]|nr:hypothetical protein [Symbiobacteriaceae bacterium]
MIKFTPDRRPSKWGATAAVAQNQTAEAVIEWLSGRQGHPFDGTVKLSEVTEHKGYRYCLLQVSLDFGHPAFGAVTDILDEMGGSEFQLIVVETPERSVYLIVDKDNLPEEEIRPDHPLLVQLADWLGPAMARR